MENKINIAELLRNCPKGMELDCTINNNVNFIKISPSSTYPIILRTKNGYEITLTKYGQVHNMDDSKCVIFPKGKTTWEGFVSPCQFKDGDVISVIINKNRWYGIYQKEFNTKLYSYVSYSDSTQKIYPSNENGMCPIDYIVEMRLATDEEKQKLFQAIKDNGYEWNPETKTLVKLPKFKIGYKIKQIKTGNIHEIIKIIPNYYITRYLGSDIMISFNDQDEYELESNKFDFSKLKPFDKVLVRDFDNETWEINFFSKLLDGKHFKCLDLSYVQCIPYEGNEYLYDTTNKCDEFFKVWES